MATTAKRGVKQAPRSQPGKWDRPEREASHTKAGPGRKRAKIGTGGPRTMVAPVPLKRLDANVGARCPWGRRIWREGEPVHIVKPVRAARVAAERAKVAA